MLVHRGVVADHLGGRFPGIIGPACDTPMTRFLKDSRAPVLLGFDPLMQVIHEDDVVGGLVHAVLHTMPGVFNVAADKAMPLSQLMALAGKVMGRMGTAHPSIVPYQSFAARDGYLIIAAPNDRLFARLAQSLGHPEWPADPRFATNAGRVEPSGRMRLYGALGSWLMGWPSFLM